MSYCPNPACDRPHNPDTVTVCPSCGQNLWLNDRFTIERLLGQGGFGRAFLGQADDQSCVIKQLYLDTKDQRIAKKVVQLFKQEADRLRELGTHPQIPKFMGNFEQAGQLYLIQEFIPGKTLSQEQWYGRVDLHKAIITILVSLLPVLQFIHDRQVIHRDIKPDNIIRRNHDGQLMLIDFGVARPYTQTAMLGGATIIGTPEFMAPEQNRGQALPASDIYSLGVTCLRLITGVSTMKMFDVMEEQWHWQDFIPDRIHLGEELCTVLNKMVAYRVRDRYHSATEVLNDLNPIFHHPPIPLLGPNTPNTVLQTSSLAPHPLTPASTTVPLVSHQTPAITPQEPEPVIVDFSHLKTYLQWRRWRKADDETCKLLLELAGKLPGQLLFNDDLEAIDQEYLAAIDQLWSDSSKGKFGFKVQLKIYQAVDREYDEFCNAVGWIAHRASRPDRYLQFSGRAPEGHLPSRRWAGGYHWWRHLDILIEKFQKVQ